MTLRIVSRTGAATLAASCILMVIPACSSDQDNETSGAVTTITLEGPNQWTDSGSSFGPAWDRLVAKFEKDNPKIKVKTVVLPLKKFGQTISTQLAAGTAPELVFNQAAYKPYMIHHLEGDLKKPNPYVSGNKAWIDLFKPKFYGLTNSSSIDAQGHVDYAPFNLFAAGVFYNKDAFAKAGVQAPVKTFADLMTACDKLTASGYTPFGLDNSNKSVGWTIRVIANMLLSKYYDEINVFDAAGKPGSNPQVTEKDWTKAILTEQITPKTPEATESLKLLKQFFDACATKNWSGITGNSGAMTNIKDFASGKAAMAWGTDYAPAALSDVTFDYASMPFPTITKDSTPLSSNFAAQYGVGTGTNYMIPAPIKGDKLKAAIKFLQWMSVGKNIQQWLEDTGAIPAVVGADAPPNTEGLTGGAWGETMKMHSGIITRPPGTTPVSLFDGYLLGSKSLSQEQSYLAGMWKKGAAHKVKANKWGNEPWAKGAS